LTTCSRAQARAGSNYPFLTQKERDVETGLDYFDARYYGSTQGRFTGVDPFNIALEIQAEAQATPKRQQQNFKFI
jgi:RHS repeat-associated protein